ncbi:MAG TPA: precorrin-8X methylmutase [Stellaceae bacterium]|nr:precorrin-8X methylmutase [Stellaceae bacterium]
MTDAPRYSYLREPDAIYRASFAAVEREADLAGVPAELRAIAVRIAHAAGDVSVIADLAASPGAPAAGRAALAAGVPVLADAAMVAAGINLARLPRGNRVVATIGDARVPLLAERLGTTRAAAAVELWRPLLAGAVVAIGHAPTALFRLLETVGEGAPAPALILGFPVGFVGAAEAKAALAANPFGVRFITLHGRRGGSAMAAAALNALASEGDP